MINLSEQDKIGSLIDRAAQKIACQPWEGWEETAPPDEKTREIVESSRQKLPQTTLPKSGDIVAGLIQRSADDIARHSWQGWNETAPTQTERDRLLDPGNQRPTQQ